MSSQPSSVSTPRTKTQNPPTDGSEAVLPLCTTVDRVRCRDPFDLAERRLLGMPQVSWTDSTTGTRWLGFGAVDRLIAETPDLCSGLPDTCRERLLAIEAPSGGPDILRYFGGISFDPCAEPRVGWESGARATFVLPRVLIEHRRGEPTARVAVTLPARSATEKREAGRTSGMLLRAIEECDPPAARERKFRLRRIEIPTHREQWDRAILRALEAIEAGTIRKLVLSREIVLEADEAIDPWGIVRRIEAKRPYGVQFCFRFDEGAALIGATPERLFTQEGRRVSCDCLAGTAARNDADGQPVRSARLLLASVKDRHEHALVLEGILEALGPVTEWLEHPASPRVLTLPKLHHLSSPVSGWLRTPTRLETLLRRLHPTPAVGGSPRADALRLIRELEGRPRGWYAGPIGWVSRDAADFGVGIRSGIVRDNRVILTGGAGIVQGSTAENEWEETARKAASFLSLFNGEDD